LDEECGLPVDSPERRYILGLLIQTLQDAQTYANAPESDKLTEVYLDSVEVHAQWITSQRFFKYCEMLDLSPWRVSSIVMDIMRGRRKINTKSLKKGLLQADYEVTGFAAWDREKLLEISGMGGRAFVEKYESVEKCRKQKETA
jgi:hypothetical protein